MGLVAGVATGVRLRRGKYGGGDYIVIVDERLVEDLRIGRSGKTLRSKPNLGMHAKRQPLADNQASKPLALSPRHAIAAAASPSPLRSLPLQCQDDLPPAIPP